MQTKQPIYREALCVFFTPSEQPTISDFFTKLPHDTPVNVFLVSTAAFNDSHPAIKSTSVVAGDIFKAMERASFDKRCYELENNIEFSKCAFSTINHIDSFECNINPVSANTLVPKSCLKLLGISCISVSFEFFSADSMTFDIACRYHSFMGMARSFQMRDTASPEFHKIHFYEHLKSCYINVLGEK